MASSSEKRSLWLKSMRTDSELHIKDTAKVLVDEEISVPRAQWVPKVLKKHPEVLELRERFRPLSKVPSFGRAFNAGKTEVKEVLSPKVVLQLIMQYLHEEGHRETLKCLEEESQTSFQQSALTGTHPAAPTNNLVGLLRVGVKDPKSIFSPLPENEEDGDEEVQAYENMIVGGSLEEEDEDIPVWDEGPADATNTLYAGDDTPVPTAPPNGTPTTPTPSSASSGTRFIRAATLNKLVEYLTSDKAPDLTFRKVFLLTYQSFTTPEKLLLKLIQRYHVPASRPTADADKKTIHPQIIVVLKYWIDHYPADWNEKLVASLNNFIDNILVRDGHKKYAKQLRNTLTRKESSAVVSSAAYYGGMAGEPAAGPIPEPKVPRNIFSATLTLDDVDEEEIARQLTLIDRNIYVAVTAPELLNKHWSNAKLSSHRATNVTALLRRFNDISKWVASSILRQPKLKLRARTMARFLRIADFLHRLRSFHSLAAVFAGLSCSAVQRLKLTRAELPKECAKVYDDLAALLSPRHSYKAYRELCASLRPPCIPFLGVTLRDLSVIEESNPDKIGSLINFEKRVFLSRVLMEFLRFQPVGYNYHYIHQVAVFLTSFDIIDDEEELWKRSLSIDEQAEM